MDSVSAKIRDKRNRVLERETNELKDELCAMRHIVHLLDNIKRVSNDCIQYLHLMVDAAIRTDNNQLDQLKDDVRELEDELKAWERKYQLMSQMQSMPEKTPSLISNKKSNNNLINNNISHKFNANNNDTTNDSIEANGGVDPSEGYEMSANGSYYDSDRNEDCAQSSHNSMVLMPQELCEMSMETNDNEAVQIHSSDASPQSQHQRTGSPLLDAIQLLAGGVQDLSSGKSLFECDWNGCDFRTNMRQRLVMHKRLHAGEALFSCDIPGCGYQSNYKGNIKIHKKHRHRIDSDDNKDNKEYSPLIINTQNNNNNTNNLSHHLTKNNNFSSNMIRKRKRKKKFRFTVSRPNATVKTTGSGQLDADPNAQTAKTSERISTLFTCTVKGCNYRSKWKQCLTAHQLLHAGVKPFKCDHPGCNYRTNFKGNVNVHKRVHRESQYQCQVNGCQFSTPWKNSFNQHQRNHIINNTETTLNIDNHIELHSDDNDLEDDEDADLEDSSPEQLEPQLSVQRNVLQTIVSPLLPVQRIQNLSTNEILVAKHRNSESKSMQNIQTTAQPLVPPMVGVIKTIKSEI